MFEQRVYRSTTQSAFGTIDVIYHSIVRNVRNGPSAGGLGLIATILQTVVMILVFYSMMSLLGMRGAKVRGDIMLYLMSGIFLFMIHVKSIGAVFGAGGPTSPMLQHAPLNTIVVIISSAVSALYIQLLSMAAILSVYHALINPITIDKPLGALSMVLMAWFSGVAVGMVFLAVKPWAPWPVAILKSAYTRVNMLASGKLFVANAMPGFMLPYFTWNPLFHTIDQARGFTFLNYSPHYSSVTYPLYVSLSLIMVGLMGEFFTRQHASRSWAARAS